MAITYETTVTDLAPRDQQPVTEMGNTTAQTPVPPAGSGWRLKSVAISTYSVYYTWVQGSPVITITSSPFNMQDGDEVILVDATSGPITVNLSTPVEGTTVSIKKIDSSSNAVTIDGNGNNIDGDPTQTINNQFTAFKLAANGTDWFIV